MYKDLICDKDGIEFNNVGNKNYHFSASEINILYSCISFDGICLVFLTAMTIN